MIKQKMSPGVLPDYVMDYVLKSLQRITFGEVVLVAQDGVLVQLEWNEKRRLDHWDETLVQRPWTDGLIWGKSELVPTVDDPVYNTGAK